MRDGVGSCAVRSKKGPKGAVGEPYYHRAAPTGASLAVIRGLSGSSLSFEWPEAQAPVQPIGLLADCLTCTYAPNELAGVSMNPPG